MPILNLRNTAGEFEPIPAMIGPQGAQGVPGPNEITTATATPLSGVLVGKDGTVREGVAGEDFAEVNHAHGNITHDGKVGATADLPLFTGAGGAVGTKTAAEAITALGAQRASMFNPSQVLSHSVYVSGGSGGDALIFVKAINMSTTYMGVYYFSSYAKQRVRCVSLTPSATDITMTVDNTTETGTVTFTSIANLQIGVFPLLYQFNWMTT